MIVPCIHPGPRLTRILLVAALLLPLSGCQSITEPRTPAQLRIIDATPDAPGLDVYQGNGVLAHNLGLGTVTSYVRLAPGARTIIVHPAGTRQQMASVSGVFLPGSQHTVIISNYLATLEELLLVDQAEPASPGSVAMRFIDQSTRAGPVDLYLVPRGATIASVRPILTNINFGASPGYLSLPAGTYTLAVLSAGTVPAVTSATLYMGPATLHAAGSAKTILLLDQPSPSLPGLQLITLTDYDASLAAN